MIEISITMYLVALSMAAMLGLVVATGWWNYLTRKNQRELDAKLIEWKKATLTTLEESVADDIPFSIKSSWPERKHDQQEEG